MDGNTEPGVVFDGATQLPLYTDDPDPFLAALRSWCALLSEVRRVIDGATWKVRVDDHDMAWVEEDHDVPWVEELRAFDPSVFER